MNAEEDKAEEERIEVEPAGEEFKVPADQRPHMDEPLPVNLVAVADVRAPGRAGLEKELSAFYVGLWGFERDEAIEGLAFRAENFRLILDVQETPADRADFRPIGVEVPSLAEAVQKLVERELEYTHQKGLQPGTQSILLQDPAGNWVELTERREI